MSVSNIIQPGQKTITGYAHTLYFGKTSGRFMFNVYQELYDNKYDKSDLGFFTNNNTMDQSLWMGYRWNKPKHWYNQMGLNFNAWYGRLVTPIDNLKRRSMMFQNAGFNVNGFAQTKKLTWFGFNINKNLPYNDFYEPRSFGRVFHNKGSFGVSLWYESNSAKKYSWTTNVFTGVGGVFDRKSLDISLSFKARFNSKFSFDYSIYCSNATDQPGWAASEMINNEEVIYFSRRDVKGVENVVNLKYNFNNRMGLTMRTRHSWTKVNPQQFYELNAKGDLVTPTVAYAGNVRQNFNFLSTDLVYNWQFAQGSFFSVVWKDIAGGFSREFERNYFKNFTNTVDGDHATSFSVKVIYFIDYLTAKEKLNRKHQARG